MYLAIGGFVTWYGVEQEKEEQPKSFSLKTINIDSEDEEAAFKKRT